MPVAAVIALLLLDPPNPGDLNPLIEHYKALSSITFTVVHHGDVGAPGKDNADRIYWSKGRFDIDPIPFGDNPASRMPKLVCNDGQVTAFPLIGDLTITPLDPGPDAVGAWETRGGLLLDWLMDGKTWKRMIEPHEAVRVKFSTGPLTTWHDNPCREITLRQTVGRSSIDYLIFVSPKGDELLGTEYDIGDKPVWTEFRDEDCKPGSGGLGVLAPPR